MGIKRNTEVVAEVLNTKASRLQAIARAEQAERLFRQDEQVRPVKAKSGKQSLRGRVRVERCTRWEEVADFNDEVEREYHWGVVCHSKDDEWYVTTAAMLEDRIDLNTVAVRHHTDRVIGVMGYWERDLRFAAMGRAHRDWAATEGRIIVGWSLDKEYYFYRK